MSPELVRILADPSDPSDLIRPHSVNTLRRSNVPQLNFRLQKWVLHKNSSILFSDLMLETESGFRIVLSRFKIQASSFSGLDVDH